MLIGLNLFPNEPSSYHLISTNYDTFTWKAPEDGYFQIEVFGASGNGGDAIQAISMSTGYAAVTGGGGGGGAYSCSRIKMLAGETIVIDGSLAIGGTVTVNLNSSLETYPAMIVVSGKDGTDASQENAYRDGKVGVGGAGGTASNGNYKNINGGIGGDGQYFEDFANKAIHIDGGVGGTAAHEDGNVGGVGGGCDYKYSMFSSTLTPFSGASGNQAFVKIYRGDTNKTSSYFPDAPTEYVVYERITSSQTWVVPETGWYQIELQGASGSGGHTTSYESGGGAEIDGVQTPVETYYRTGGGGGGGGCAISRVQLYAGDTIDLSFASLTTAIINSAFASYRDMEVTSGRSGSSPDGGAGGVGSGGNYANYTGGTGQNGANRIAEGGSGDPADGGAAGYGEGNVGGKGSGFYDLGDNSSSPTSGKAGFAIIYSGNTN